MGAPSSVVPRRNPSTSSRASSSSSAVTRSAFVSATSPARLPMRFTMSMCSRVCGITPSSAATTRRTMSMPATPASIVRTKRSWPGTSTMPTDAPLGRSSRAKPSSIEMPRSFSSFSRSVSTPVSALTRAVLPWSMWPAVPRTTCFVEEGTQHPAIPPDPPDRRAEPASFCSMASYPRSMWYTRETSVSPSATSPARMSAALARRSVAITLRARQAPDARHDGHVPVERDVGAQPPQLGRV